MQYKEKAQLIALLSEMKTLLPPVEERKFLTCHYREVENRIDKAISGLKDRDFLYMERIYGKLCDLELKGKLSMSEVLDFYIPVSNE